MSVNDAHTSRRTWTAEEVDDRPGFGSYNLAAFECRECGAIIPITWVNDQAEPPEEMPKYGCMESFGGCGEWGPMDLVEIVRWRDRP